jgi:hypothetical protein
MCQNYFGMCYNFRNLKLRRTDDEKTKYLAFKKLGGGDISQRNAYHINISSRSPVEEPVHIIKCVYRDGCSNWHRRVGVSDEKATRRHHNHDEIDRLLERFRHM